MLLNNSLKTAAFIVLMSVSANALPFISDTAESVSVQMKAINKMTLNLLKLDLDASGPIINVMSRADGNATFRYVDTKDGISRNCSGILPEKLTKEQSIIQASHSKFCESANDTTYYSSLLKKIKSNKEIVQDMNIVTSKETADRISQALIGGLSQSTIYVKYTTVELIHPQDNQGISRYLITVGINENILGKAPTSTRKTCTFMAALTNSESLDVNISFLNCVKR